MKTTLLFIMTLLLPVITFSQENWIWSESPENQIRFLHPPPWKVEYIENWILATNPLNEIGLQLSLGANINNFEAIDRLLNQRFDNVDYNLSGPEETSLRYVEINNMDCIRTEGIVTQAGDEIAVKVQSCDMGAFTEEDNDYLFAIAWCNLAYIGTYSDKLLILLQNIYPLE